MKNNRFIQIVVQNWVLPIMSFVVFIQGCVEPFDPVTVDFQRGVVIEATLTNELKQHEVFLSKVYSFEKDSVTTINDASVMIMDVQGNEYGFSEVEDGRYLSNSEFAAQKGVGYTLVINTIGGRTYRSTVESFEDEAEITAVYAERGTNSLGKDGINIYVDGNASTGNAQYFRYTYEETYKIIAPKYINLDFKQDNFDPCAPITSFNFRIEPREEEQRVCYGSQKSDNIVQTSTLGLAANSIARFPVRFIPSDDYILANRYSILVKQNVQSVDAHSYYNKLNEFSTSESVFTDVQPGFLEGNIRADDEKAEAVIGYFEVTSVSSARLFFNYSDFFNDEDLPDYPIDCDNNFFRPQIVEMVSCDVSSFPHCSERSIYEMVNEGSIAYWNEIDENLGCDGGPYIAMPRACGDCTQLGSNVVPDFWIE